jgi:hypothetical protein
MNRLGFHYFPDTQHYRQKDLEIWLPELKALNAKWLVLLAPVDRAIPEHFIQELLAANIEPLLHFKFSPDQIPPYETLQLLFGVYAKWGLKHIILFDMPNLRTTWKTTAWAQNDLVERFLDKFLPLAELGIRAGLNPIFPPLKPGGDYWDTAFLPAALAGIKRRGHPFLLEKLIIGVLAWAGDRPLNWGAGGPERWPLARPYFRSEGEEDQRGFRCCDWYNSLVQSVLVEARPLFLFGMGCSLVNDSQFKNHTDQNLIMARLLASEHVSGMEPLPDNVIGGAFWLLSSSRDDHQAGMAWYPEQQAPKPIVEALKTHGDTHAKQPKLPKSDSFPIAHYLLLPTFEDSISDYHLNLIRPLVKKIKPTIGFSIEEAGRAKRVTILGSYQYYPAAEIRKLIAKGCIVDQIEDNGTLIASL